MSTTGKPEKPALRGRPATGQTPTVAFRCPPELTARIDDFANYHDLNRAAAIRLLLKKGLGFD